jgi:hypothetical protein
VIEKVCKLGIGTFLDNNENLCLAEVCRLVNRDKETIKKIWFKNGLKWHKKGKYTMIRPDDLISFMETHPQYWNGTQVESYYFERFHWFQEKRKKDRMELHNSRWQIAERIYT